MKANQRVAIALPRSALVQFLALATLMFGAVRHPLFGQTAGGRFETIVRAGDSAWKAGRFPEARLRYVEALAIDSVGSSRAVYRLATLHAWDGQLARAIVLYERYSVLEPRDEEGRVALGRALAWNGETARSVAVYDSILGRDRTYRDAALGAAQALAWAGRFPAALSRYERWLTEQPKDVEAELARARTLAWAGQLSRAEREYSAIAARGERLEAEKGVAVVAAWRGDLGRSERLWRGIAARVPKDGEAWAGLAQVLRWSGRPRQARQALDRALAANPSNPDAAEQLRWVRAELAPGLDPSVTGSWDSDQNRSLVIGTSARGWVGPVQATAFAAERWAELTPATGTSTAGRVSLRLPVGSGFGLTGDVGAMRIRAESGVLTKTHALFTGSVTGTARLASWISVGGNARRSGFDETVLMMLSGIEVTSFGADAEVRLSSRIGAAGGGDFARLVGGSVLNRRRAGFASLRWRPRRGLAVSAAGRVLGYDESPRDGYFAPQRFRHGELGVRWSRGRDLGWNLSVDAGLGAQQVSFSSASSTKGTQRIAAGIGYRPAPGLEVAADYSFSNVAATGAGPTGGGSIYRAQLITVRGKLLLRD